MEYKSFHEDIKKYQLTEEVDLERADSKEFAIYCTTYRNESLNFGKSWDKRCDEIGNFNNCFWINKDNRRIGGVRMEPNYIESLFLQPPFTDTYEMLKILKKLLAYWSDRNKDIYTVGVTASEVECYKRIGFFEKLSLRYMIRPTEEFYLNWEENFNISSVAKEKALEISRLFYEAYSDGIDDYAKQTVEEHLPQVEAFLNKELNSTLKNASVLVYDKNNNELIGVCFISLWDEWPEISNLVVKPSYRGTGLAENMIKRALSILKDEYPVLRLNVLVGNPAESLYNKLGFFTCGECSYLFMPVCYW
ncbi:GNAT family N-acetyltransferase [Clostridium cellulovorans]|uniref:GCN5-related N-acetyltransferase n=1 Tax=Clostridium cellulovorans (strain ATCC 35296 / DSM 3052 / OCM 3 / 743B) TaxID=573061 RepID=D9ST15_CLOC7|nr:GNAT family N-acetyltransferase [Clostridium cellulovorans]ADL52677.1 GCN5-related N-acetyltransferase [Clostridium cellulovorans 743B]